MKLLDTTLREGEQRFGIYFSLREKCKIAEGLLSAGLDELEIGVIKRDPQIFCLWECLKEKGYAKRLSFWCRLKKEEIEYATSFYPSKLNLSVPVSDIHLGQKLKISTKELLKRIKALGNLAVSKFEFVSLGLEDASRAEETFLLEVISLAEDVGIKRIRLSDTLGLWSPLEVCRLVKKIKNNFPDLEIGVHCHNDFGMAVANSITALESGADWADVSLLGLGERAGLAPTEEVIGYLYFVKKIKKYSIKKIVNLAKRVAEIAKNPIPPFKPLLGNKLFYCETGLHLDGIYKNPEIYEPFSPSEIGLKRVLALSAKSGVSAIKFKLKSLGVDEKFWNNPGILEALKEKIYLLSTFERRPLSDEEIKFIFQFFLQNCSKEQKSKKMTK